MALEIKKEVFNFPARYVTPRSALDEIIDKISVFNHLSVVYPNKDGTLFPLGIIRSKFNSIKIFRNRHCKRLL